MRLHSQDRNPLNAGLMCPVIRRQSHANNGTYNPAMSNELRYNFFYRVHRDRKTDTSARATGAVDHGINAHQLSLRIEQRTTGVTRINGGIGLNNIGDRALCWRLDFASQRAHYTGSKRGIQTKGIADGEHLATDRQLTGVAQR